MTYFGAADISQIVLNQKWLLAILASLSTTFHVEHFDQMFHVERYAIFVSAGIRWASQAVKTTRSVLSVSSVPRGTLG